MKNRGDLLDRQQQLAGLDRLSALDKDFVDRAVMAATQQIPVVARCCRDNARATSKDV